MDSLLYKEQEFDFFLLTGVVLNSEKFSETKITSSGGGGKIVGGNGYVSAPKINSTSEINHQFWLKDDNGTEHSVQIKGFDIPILVGQKVSVVYGGLKGYEKTLLLLVNHAARKRYWLIEHDKAVLPLYQGSRKRFWLEFFVINPFLYFGVMSFLGLLIERGFLHESEWLFVFSIFWFIGFPVFLFLRAAARRSKVKKFVMEKISDAVPYLE